MLLDDIFHQKNIDLVHNILINNCFPEHIIRRHIQKRIKVSSDRDKNKKVDKSLMLPDMTSFMTLPYVENVNPDLRRTLRNCGFNIVYKITKKSNTLIKRGKDILVIMHKRGPFSDLVHF